MIVVGLDLSLTSTGIATVEVGPVSVWQAKVERITSEGRKDATLQEREVRLHNLRLDICTRTRAHEADLVLVEGPSYGSQHGSQHDRSGLWWMVVDWLIDNDPTEGWDRKVVEVPPGSLKRYATGKGNAAKDAVLAAVVRRYPTVEVTGNDEADALVLAAMGARHLGEPVDDPMPKTHLAAMDAVAWPLE